MKRKFLNKGRPFGLLLFCWVLTAQADKAALVSANNQASVNALLQYQNLDYSGGSSAYPLYNLHGLPYGARFELSKTFSHLYTTLGLSLISANLAYNNSSLNLSRASTYVQQVSGRIGYSFYPAATVSVTPYAMLAYQHWQLDTGGYALAGNRVNGITQVFQLVQSGLGLLTQWAPTTRWVWGADLLVIDNSHSWAYATLPYQGDFFYQQATLSRQLAWQAAVNSDYKLTSQLHGLLGIQYTHSGMGSGKTNTLNLTVPSQLARWWQYSAGLGYELEAAQTDLDEDSGNRASLRAVNNEVAAHFGLLFQDYGEFEKGKPGYLDRETGQMPQWGISLSKTWRDIYGQAAFNQANGISAYNGSDIFTGEPLTGSTRTTMTDIFSRLGYQLFIQTALSITPYGILGYHRWFRSIGYPETYHNNWVGWGALVQWAPTSKLVLSLDGNVGNTFNSQLHTWNTFEKPNTILFTSKLGSRSYLMAGIGGDLSFAKVWHLLAQVNYWRFNYGYGPPVNSLGDHEPTSNTRLFAATLGLGHSL